MKPHRGIKRNKLRREERRKDAEQRNTAWNNLTPQQQLAALDSRLGAGQGAQKQRAKIEKLLRKTKQKGDKDERK